jgi:hypothetical protein
MRAAAGAAATQAAAAAIARDRSSARVDRVAAGRPLRFNEHLENVGGATQRVQYYRNERQKD